MAQYKIEEQAWVNHNLTDGLQGLEFNFGASLKSMDGKYRSPIELLLQKDYIVEAYTSTKLTRATPNTPITSQPMKLDRA